MRELQEEQGLAHVHKGVVRRALHPVHPVQEM